MKKSCSCSLLWFLLQKRHSLQRGFIRPSLFVLFNRLQSFIYHRLYLAPVLQFYCRQSLKNCFSCFSHLFSSRHFRRNVPLAISCSSFVYCRQSLQNCATCSSYCFLFCLRWPTWGDLSNRQTVVFIASFLLTGKTSFSRYLKILQRY